MSRDFWPVMRSFLWRVLIQEVLMYRDFWRIMRGRLKVRM